VPNLFRWFLFRPRLAPTTVTVPGDPHTQGTGKLTIVSKSWLRPGGAQEEPTIREA
jgi:hypothetical protein